MAEKVPINPILTKASTLTAMGFASAWMLLDVLLNSLAQLVRQAVDKVNEKVSDQKRKPMRFLRRRVAVLMLILGSSLTIKIKTDPTGTKAQNDRLSKR